MLMPDQFTHHMVEIRVALRPPCDCCSRWTSTPGVLLFDELGNGLYDDISPILGLAKDIRTEQPKIRRTFAGRVKVMGLLAAAAERSGVCELTSVPLAQAAAGRALW